FTGSRLASGQQLDRNWYSPVNPSAPDRRRPWCTSSRRSLLWLAVLALAAPGCAAITNPVANGIPVRLLPPELHAPSRAGYELLPLTLLRQPPPEVYRLAPGDTLGVYIDGILGSSETPAPVNIPESADLPP